MNKLKILILFFLINSINAQFYFGRNKIQFHQFNWNVLETEHFQIYYYEQEKDIVLIKFCQIDEQSMKFWRGVVRQGATNGNPFSEPMNLVSNINGGLGIWTGYSPVYYKVPIIKGRTIKETYNDSLFITDIF